MNIADGSGWMINTSFSRLLPTLQIAVDSTSLGEAKTCFRRYYYTIRLGYQSRITSVHLTFGLLLHAGREHYYSAMAGKVTDVPANNHDEAVDYALDWTLRTTWHKESGRPWTSDDPNKNRFTLIRTLIWYFEKYRNDPFKTVILADGSPAVELKFQFDSGFTSSTGEPFILCGYLDRIGSLNDVAYPMDLKSSKSKFDTKKFAEFTPDNQFSTYTLAGRVVYKLEMSNLILDGCQILVGGSRFERGLIPRPAQVIDEWLRGTGRWLTWMNECAQEEIKILGRDDGVDPAEAWPMNDKSCNMYGGCAFRGVCSRMPSARQSLLSQHYTRRVWDPLQKRGDI